MEDDFKLNVFKKEVNGVLKLENEFIPYFKLLQQIRNSEMDLDNLLIIDDNDNRWVFTKEYGSFVKDDRNDNTFLSEYYDDIMLPGLMVKIINEPKKPNLNDEAKAKVLNELEMMFMDLEMTIDNCQGCMDDLEFHFERLKVYQSLIEFLGGNLTTNKPRMVEEWFKRTNEQAKQENLKKIFEPAQTCMLDFIEDKSKYGKAILDLILTVNAIVNKLNEKE